MVILTIGCLKLPIKLWYSNYQINNMIIVMPEGETFSFYLDSG
jgi:hypothetical protein